MHLGSIPQHPGYLHPGLPPRVLLRTGPALGAVATWQGLSQPLSLNLGSARPGGTRGLGFPGPRRAGQGQVGQGSPAPPLSGLGSARPPEASPPPAGAERDLPGWERPPRPRLLRR